MKTVEDRVENAHSDWASAMSGSMNPIDSFTEFKAGWNAAVRECCAVAYDSCINSLSHKNDTPCFCQRFRETIYAKTGVKPW